MSTLLAHELVSENGHVVQRSMTEKRSIFGFMSHMTNLWQVNGNGNLSRSEVTAMVKSTGHIIVTSITVEMNLHNLDQSSSVSSFTLLYKCSSRASQFQDVQAFAVEALAVQSWPIFQEQFTDTSPQQRFKEVSAVPYLKISTFKILNCEEGKSSKKKDFR